MGSPSLAGLHTRGACLYVCACVCLRFALLLPLSLSPPLSPSFLFSMDECTLSAFSSTACFLCSSSFSFLLVAVVAVIRLNVSLPLHVVYPYFLFFQLLFFFRVPPSLSLSLVSVFVASLLFDVQYSLMALGFVLTLLGIPLTHTHTHTHTRTSKTPKTGGRKRGMNDALSDSLWQERRRGCRAF